MEFKSLREYLLQKKGAIEDIPFGPDSLVFKVAGKMFALIAWKEKQIRMNYMVKVDADK